MRMACGLVMLSLVSVPAFSQTPESILASIEGAWHTDRYLLKDGSEYELNGFIFFTESDWTVLMFIADEDGSVRRGSGEGGTYTLEGDKLTFTHFFNLSAGEAFGSFDELPLRMTVREEADAAVEPCEVDLSATSMTIHFPSGNRIEFTKSSGP